MDHNCRHGRRLNGSDSLNRHHLSIPQTGTSSILTGSSLNSFDTRTYRRGTISRLRHMMRTARPFRTVYVHNWRLYALTQKLARVYHIAHQTSKHQQDDKVVANSTNDLHTNPKRQPRHTTRHTTKCSWLMSNVIRIFLLHQDVEGQFLRISPYLFVRRSK